MINNADKKTKSSTIKRHTRIKMTAKMKINHLAVKVRASGNIQEEMTTLMSQSSQASVGLTGEDTKLVFF